MHLISDADMLFHQLFVFRNSSTQLQQQNCKYSPSSTHLYPIMDSQWTIVVHNNAQLYPGDVIVVNLHGESFWNGKEWRVYQAGPCPEGEQEDPESELAQWRAAFKASAEAGPVEVPMTLWQGPTTEVVSQEIQGMEMPLMPEKIETLLLTTCYSSWWEEEESSMVASGSIDL